MPLESIVSDPFRAVRLWPLRNASASPVCATQLVSSVAGVRHITGELGCAPGLTATQEKKINRPAEGLAIAVPPWKLQIVGIRCGSRTGVRRRTGPLGGSDQEGKGKRLLPGRRMTNRRNKLFCLTQQNRTNVMRYRQNRELRCMVRSARGAAYSLTIRRILGFAAAIRGALGCAVTTRATLHHSFIGNPGIHTPGDWVQKQECSYDQPSDVSGVLHRSWLPL